MDYINWCTKPLSLWLLLICTFIKPWITNNSYQSFSLKQFDTKYYRSQWAIMKTLLADSMRTQLHFPVEDLIKYSQLTHYLIFPKWSETDFEHSQKSPVVSPDGFLEAVCTIVFHQPAYAHVLAWQPVSHTVKENNSKDWHTPCFNSSRKATELFVSLITIHLKEKKVGYHDSADKLSPQGDCKFIDKIREICNGKIYQTTGK